MATSSPRPLPQPATSSTVISKNQCASLKHRSLGVFHAGVHLRVYSVVMFQCVASLQFSADRVLLLLVAAAVIASEYFWRIYPKFPNSKSVYPVVQFEVRADSQGRPDWAWYQNHRTTESHLAILNYRAEVQLFWLKFNFNNVNLNMMSSRLLWLFW